MKPISQIIAENLIALRKKHNLTQNDLAQKLQYSDNTISRWEHAEITPSIETLEKISQLYNIPLESLLKENITQEVNKQEHTQKVSRICTALLYVLVVWFVSTIIFVYGQTIFHKNMWTLFIWSLPLSCLILVPFNDKRIYRFVVLTILVWTFLLAFFLEFYRFRLWLIFLCGIPIELALIIWAFIKPKKIKKD